MKKRFYDKQQSKKDASMISGPVGMANLPQDVVMKYYPKGQEYLSPNLNDGITGVDKQMTDEVRELKGELSKSKF
jgi:hypothetical protein